MAFFVRVSPRSGKGLNPNAPLGMETGKQSANETEGEVDERNARSDEEQDTKKGKGTAPALSARGVEQRGNVLENTSHVVDNTANRATDGFKNVIDH